MTKIFVQPALGRRVRKEDGRGHIAEAGELVSRSTYYARRLNAGDLIEAEAPTPEATNAQALRKLLAALEKDNPAHWTEGGEPSLNYLSDVLNRRVTRKEVTLAMQEMEA